MQQSSVWLYTTTSEASNYGVFRRRWTSSLRATDEQQCRLMHRDRTLWAGCCVIETGPSAIQGPAIIEKRHVRLLPMYSRRMHRSIGITSTRTRSNTWANTNTNINCIDGIGIGISIDININTNIDVININCIRANTTTERWWCQGGTKPRGRSRKKCQ